MIRRLSRHLTINDRNFGRVVILLVGLGFLTLVVAGGAAVWVQLRNQDHIRWVEHTYEVEARLSDIAVLNERVETARRGYLITADSSYRAIFDDASRRLIPLIEHVTELTADNARQQARIRGLRLIVERQRTIQQNVMSLVDNGSVGLAARQFRQDDGVLLTRQVRALLEEMQAEEARLLVTRDAAQVKSRRTFYVVLSLTGVLLLIVAITSMTVILRYNRDLTRSRDSLRKLNENLEEAVQERTVDLQRANDEIQRFAYIVSHDLRSPLVNVMGFTAELDASRKPLLELVDTVQAAQPDLITDAARLAVTEDLPEAIGFIRTSTQKMDRLINAILRLSREGRRTIAPERVEVEELLASIADSLQHRVTELGAEIRIEAPVPAIVSDRLALEQIFSNLVENAVKYLQPGRPGLIRVRGRRERDRIIYEVEDNGRGIDPRDHERVFDLFRRSGQQDQPGEGIGLAHVRALAYRLGGIIDVKSELDRGATFRLSLPAKFEAVQKLEGGRTPS